MLVKSTKKLNKRKSKQSLTNDNSQKRFVSVAASKENQVSKASLHQIYEKPSRGLASTKG